MEQLKQFLLWPENWQASREASFQVLQILEPGNAEIYGIFVDPGLDMVANEEITTVTTTDVAGGFGTPDLLVAVVVPAVVSALSAILTQAGITTLTDFRRKRISGQEIVFDVSGKVESVIKIINPSLKPREVQQLVGDIQNALRKFLTSDDWPGQEGFTVTKLTQLRDLIHEYFNVSELRTLCFNINIDYEDLIGETKEDKVRELLLYCTRHGSVTELVNACRQARPQVDW